MKFLLPLFMLNALIHTSFGEESKCLQHLIHDNKHTFALTTLSRESDEGGPDALYKQAADACYQNCHSAGLMTLSKNYWKDRTPITLLDRATTFLIESGFFQVNQTYFVNQIVIAEEGPHGLGCFTMNSATDFSLHSLDDPACNSTQSVVCGMPGTQFNTPIKDTGNNTAVTQKNDTTSTINPDKDVNDIKDPVINISSGIAETITRATSNDGNGSINGTAVDPQITQLHNEKKVPEQEKQLDAPAVEATMQDGDTSTIAGPNSTDVPVLANVTATTNTSIPAPDENDLVYNLAIGDINYKVVRLQKIHTTTESAATMCQSHHDKIGSLYSLSIPSFSSWFQRVHPMSKTIIGSWNGDSYGANGPQCLIYSTAQGVHLGLCTDASVLLCESNLLATVDTD